ncbi:hypothetical protein [Burkholderia cepacia]|uniref:hypothetical protein n=1 Tax=Burkholderia cepacia TaxID=292 RepID=UPI00264F8A26|nr:hypothetical protein [Burkholderia cepacia]MDN7614944.1 hypothetical protein [Burkholderia cepacia]
MTLHGWTRSARGRRTIFQPLVISVHAARHAAHSRDERIGACRLPPGGTREASGIQHARAAEALRCDVGSGAADGVQSSMHPAKTLAQFHCLERRLCESNPRQTRLLDISLQTITDVAAYRSLQFRFLRRAHDAPRFRPSCGR